MKDHFFDYYSEYSISMDRYNFIEFHTNIPLLYSMLSCLRFNFFPICNDLIQNIYFVLFDAYNGTETLCTMLRTSYNIAVNTTTTKDHKGNTFLYSKSHEATKSK